MANKILIIFAHPRFESSSNNSLLVQQVPDIPEVTFHDLYEKYPDFNIDIENEKRLVSDHQVIIWHHPFYWYSAPPLLKQWIDLVLEFGWAYGPGGDALKGKLLFHCLTMGGQRGAYNKEGYNRFTVMELLAPFYQTAYLCKMIWLPPFAVHGTHRISDEEKTLVARQYGLLLERIVNGDFSVNEINKYTYMNDWLASLTAKISAQ
jgi:glutathione-regulated potassium-efflux system ancillary protein KefG